MKPAKQKAEELILNFCQERMLHNYGYCNLNKETAKQCALIAINEIKKVVEDNCLEYEDDYWEELIKEVRKY